MAVLSVEVFARTEQHAPLSPREQVAVRERFSYALLKLRDTSTPTLIVDAQVSPHASGAFISALCVAQTGTAASEAIAEQLVAVLNEHAGGEQWSLHAGVTLVIASNN